ncbi:MAG TPA: DUF6221 family protein [Mycobacteriales bacterium]|jgi:hypothetical protein
MATTIVEFITARLDEAEVLAQVASPGPWRPDDEHYAVLASDGEHVADGFALSSNQWRNTVDHIVAHDPVAVLRDLAAMRGILAEHHPVDPCDAHNAALESVPCKTLRLIASRWPNHPDYQPAWRP